MVTRFGQSVQLSEMIRQGSINICNKVSEMNQSHSRLIINIQLNYSDRIKLLNNT